MGAGRGLPPGVLAHYVTAGGATVDLYGRRGKAGLRAACTGCPAIHGPYAEDIARAWARAHAEKCRALPKGGRPGSGTTTTVTVDA